MHKPANSWGKRLVWLLLIWLASIAALALVSVLLRGLMHMAGLHT